MKITWQANNGPRTLHVFISQRAFSIYKNFRKFLLGISVWEERVPFVTSPIRSQAPLCRFTKRPRCLSELFCYFLEHVFLRCFPAKQMLIRHMWLREVASASSHLSRFTVVEISLVNEELQKNFSDLYMQHFTRETCPDKKKASNKPEFLPTTFMCGTFILQ